MSTHTNSLRVAASLVAVLLCASATASICGANDTRQPSPNPAVGRLVYNNSVHVGTAWIASNGALVTAGHCMRDRPVFVEFLVPVSNCDGTINNAPVSNRFRINPDTVVFQDSSYDSKAHGDWAVFQVDPNSEGKYPVEKWNEFYRPTQTKYPAGTTLRVTGYGVVYPAIPLCASLSRTEQTATGLLVSYDQDENDEFVEYAVDAVENNSGSPIIVDPTNTFVIGIHTNSTCGLRDFQGNTGNTFFNADFADALSNLGGKRHVYVDWKPGQFPIADGSIFKPYDHPFEAFDVAKDGDTVSIVAGSYCGSLVITPPGTIVVSAPVGDVSIAVGNCP